jgi:hypothetical protein
MKRTALAVTACLSLGLSALASPQRTIPQGSVEFTLGSYSMNEPRFEAVYPSGGLISGLTLSSAVASNVNLYLDIKYYSRQGVTTFTKEETTFYMVPLSLGARYIYPLGLFNPYLGAGLDFYFYYEESFETELSSTNGFHITGGTYLRFLENVPLLVNVRLKYTWAKAGDEDVPVQLGGFEFGAGLAFTF